MLLLPAAAASGAELLVYAGSTGAHPGIYGYRFDARGPRLRPLGLLAALSNPSRLLEHPDHRFLYSLSAEGVSAFLIGPKSGKLSLVNKVSSKGASPCDLALDRSGTWLAVANRGGASVSILPLRQDGGLGDARAIALPAGARPEGLAFSPDNRFLLVADEASSAIATYRFDAKTGALTPSDPPVTAIPGAGVHRLAFHPNGHELYAVNEARPGVTAFRYDPATGGLAEFQTLPVPQPAAAEPSAAEIVFNRGGSMAYESQGSSDSVGLLVVDPDRFTLSALEFTPLIGAGPHAFVTDPTGAFLLMSNRDSDNLTIYTVHPHSGQLRPVGRATPPIEHPVCLVAVPVP